MKTSWPSTVMTKREEYQLAALSLVGMRRQRHDENIAAFLRRHDAQVVELKRLWLDLADRTASPSPDQVLAWL